MGVCLKVGVSRLNVGEELHQILLQKEKGSYIVLGVVGELAV
jgi:hypothetical protein